MNENKMNENKMKALAVLATLALTVMALVGIIGLALPAAAPVLECPDLVCPEVALPQVVVPEVDLSAYDMTGMGSQGRIFAEQVFIDGSKNPGLYVDQEGSGDIVRFDDNGTEVFSIAGDGVATWTGGTLELTEDVTVVNVLTYVECGKTMFLNSATEFSTTLPAISTVDAGCAFRFIVKAAPSGAAYTVITGNSLENVLIGGINELEVDTNDDGPYVSAGDTITFTDGTAVVGDYVYMISDGTSFYLHGQANVDGGVVPGQAD